MRKYRYWTLDDLKGAVLHLEEAQATGAASVSYSAAGQVQYVMRSSFQALLRDLYDAIDAREGRASTTVYRVRIGIAGKGFR